MGLPKRKNSSYDHLFLKQHAENSDDSCKVTGGGRPIFEVPIHRQVCPAMIFPHAFTIFSGLLAAGAADLMCRTHGEADHQCVR